MKIELSERQWSILKKLCFKNEGEKYFLYEKLKNGLVGLVDIEEFCSVINDEFMMEGILPNYEPNEYGLELEALLDSINHFRCSGHDLN